MGKSVTSQTLNKTKKIIKHLKLMLPIKDFEMCNIVVIFLFCFFLYLNTCYTDQNIKI